MAEEFDHNEWIGRTEAFEDNLDVGHLARIAATLGATNLDVGDVIPPLWHWALFIVPLKNSSLGPDGYIGESELLPPANNRLRMWAGSTVESINPLLVGKHAQRKSTVKAITEKQGRSGNLLFVTIQNEYLQDFVLCIRETQDYVYRAPSAPLLTGTRAADKAEWTEEITPTNAMLFRYSAVTFNSHRIHYDYEYATKEEGYPGLVVHGPLIATFMCAAFRRAHPEANIISFSHRGLRPLISPKPFTVAGCLVQETEIESESTERVAKIWAEQDGTLAQEGEIRFKL